jgi:aspartate aminotransferase-like enzyme
MIERCGILIGGGFRERKGKVLRIGHMGYNAILTNITTTMAELRRTIEELSKTRTRAPTQHCA